MHEQPVSEENLWKGNFPAFHSQFPAPQNHRRISSVGENVTYLVPWLGETDGQVSQSFCTEPTFGCSLNARGEAHPLEPKHVSGVSIPPISTGHFLRNMTGMLSLTPYMGRHLLPYPQPEGFRQFTKKNEIEWEEKETKICAKTKGVMPTLTLQWS